MILFQDTEKVPKSTLKKRGGKMSCGLPGENILDERGSLSGVERSKEHGSEKLSISHLSYGTIFTAAAGAIKESPASFLHLLLLLLF